MTCTCPSPAITHPPLLLPIRMLNQTSTLGAVLDMVTDRLATTGLFMLLAMQYPDWYMLCISLVFLDIFSHW